MASADVILLNKVDLVTAPMLDEVERVVRGINSTLRIHRTERSKLDLRNLFGVRAFSTNTEPDEPNRGQSQNPLEHVHDVVDRHEGEHVHTDITTVLIPLPTLSAHQFTQLNAFLECLLWEGKLPACSSTDQTPLETVPEMEILRTKGYIRIEDGRTFILQGVTDIFELKQLSKENEDTQRAHREGGKVVFIGRGVTLGLHSALEEYIGIEALV